MSDKRDCPDRWQRQGQTNELTPENILTSEFIYDSINCSVKTACPTSEQAFLFNIWTTFELIQDSIYDQLSPEYQLFEILNPLIFDAWVRLGRS